MYQVPTSKSMKLDFNHTHPHLTHHTSSSTTTMSTKSPTTNIQRQKFDAFFDLYVGLPVEMSKCIDDLIMEAMDTIRSEMTQLALTFLYDELENKIHT